MPTNSPNWPSSWSPPSKITSSLVLIELTTDNQVELECTSNEFVFLEYPWAYVARAILLKISQDATSTLETYKSQIEAYKPEMMLLGYASKELCSTHYVLCLTEEVRDAMVSRNRQITRSIHDRVTRMLRKTPLGVIPSSPLAPVDDTVLKTRRSLFEVEISRKSSPPGPRDLSDRSSEATRDGYLDILLPPTSQFSNVRMKLVTKSLQTNLQPTPRSVQTYIGYPKTKWTQYDNRPAVESQQPHPEKTTEESSPAGHSEAVTLSDEKPVQMESLISVNESLVRQTESLRNFIEANLSVVTDCIRYNSEINMHSDDIENLAKCAIPEASTVIDYNLGEVISLVDLGATKGTVISDVAWHPSRVEYVAICYIEAGRCLDFSDHLPNHISTAAAAPGNDASVLLWSIDEPLKPKLWLVDYKEIRVMSFCPSKDSVLVGGTKTGQIVIWDLEKSFEAIDSGEELSDNDCRRLQACASSDPGESHLLQIRAIHWLPTSCRLEPTGKFSKIPDNMSMQFMTASEDGTVAFWDLLWQPNMTAVAKNLLNIVAAKMSLTEGLERLDNVFRPHYRLNVVASKETSTLTVLDICPASGEAYDEIQTDAIDPDANESARRLWASTTQGELLLCTWRGQEFDEICHENVEITGHSALIHDGPIVKIVRSHHVSDILLTIGGSVFALWKDDFLKKPLLWRKGNCLYTSCCWCHRPGVFCVARKDGDLETWDICRKTREPVHVQTISGKLITGLHRRFDGFVGVCDYSGAFRVFKQGGGPEFERIEWLRQFVDREVERNREFCVWQEEYLESNEVAVGRKEARAAEEVRRRHEEAREKFLREQEEVIRMKAERRALKIPKSKETILRMENIERMKIVLLGKKGFDPRKLEEARSPMVQQQEEKVIRMIKAREKVANRDAYFTQALAVDFPDARGNVLKAEDEETGGDDIESFKEDEEAYARVRREAREMIRAGLQIPRFDWNAVMRDSRRIRSAKDRVEDH
ncbi:WD repeat-containing protein 63 [Fopius arisanus]|uniref:WD repeat-containing protein 63 n=1 Tax=Fopius arisanus TaxID=64838 RepID=A0A0C9RE17_9HYME|nr:PREDICTED: WD repeat-containing protein 63-like [Fopius arisanus]